MGKFIRNRVLGSVRSARPFYWIALLALALGAGSVAVHAEGESSPGTTAAGTQMSSDGFRPPAFNAAQKAGFANMFSSCYGAQLGAAAGLLNCPSDPGISKDFSKNLSCESLVIDGIFSEDALKKKSTGIDDAIKSAECKKNKFDALRGELQCLDQQASALTQQMNSLTSEYQKNIQRMENDVAQLSGVVQDREIQAKDVLSKLGGDGESGEDGLLGAQKKIQAIVGKMPGDILKAKETHKQLEIQRKGLAEQIQSRTVALTSECFSSKSEATYRCSKNGAPVTLPEYVLCRYEQNQRIGEDGVIETGAVSKARAQGNRQALQALMGSIFSEASSQKNLPTNQQELQSAFSQPVGIRSVEDIQKKYGDRLAKFNGKGLDIQGFVMQGVSNCYNKAQADVARERKMQTSQISVAQEAVKTKERETETFVNALFTEYNQGYSDAMGSLTGENYPLVLTACENGKADIKDRCLVDIQKQMKGLMLGNTPESTIAMSIRGNKPESEINLTCQGINGCIKRLQNVNRNLKVEIAKVKKFKADYVQRSNQNIESFTKQMAQALSVQSQGLSTRVKELNAKLAGLGVSSGIKIPNLEGEKLEKRKEGEGEEGLFQTPTSMTKLMSAYMSPPLLNVSEDTFEGAISGMAGGIEKIEQQKSEAQEAKDKLATLASSCTQRPVNEAASSLKTGMDGLDGCFKDPQFCNNKDGLNALIESVKKMQNDMGSDQELDNLANSLSSGRKDCETASAATGSSGSRTNCDAISRRVESKAATYRDAKKASQAAKAAAAKL